MAAKKTKTDKTKETPKPEGAEAPQAETPKATKNKAEPKPKKTSALDSFAFDPHLAGCDPYQGVTPIKSASHVRQHLR
jgi:hypothetical protein